MAKTNEAVGTAVVTGAAQGLGYGIAAALATARYDVAILDLEEKDAARAAAQLAERGGRTVGLQCDVADRDQVDAAVEEVVGRLGGIGVLVNNAQWTTSGPIVELGRGDADRVVNSGLMGTLNAMQAAYPHLVRAGGSVINVGSGAGLSGVAGFGIYAATKEAIRALSRVAAVEWGPQGVRVNVISPSARTPAFDRWSQQYPEESAARVAKAPLGRYGDAEHDVGAAVVFLAGPSASYITGTTLVVDGGAHYLR